ncbi:hypothetical protein SSX86_008949 [Deinandra increscens subsp. villosa]|uniref:Uncharacterized protein n=1 Tax=Deinandra increscens subsp. villosa TaxID=3103831 RepID=A0AAP0DG79_9ASTR
MLLAQLLLQSLQLRSQNHKVSLKNLTPLYTHVIVTTLNIYDSLQLHTSEWIQLGATAATYVYLNPDIPESAALKNRSHASTSSSISATPVPIISSTAEKKTISELLRFDRRSAAGRKFVCEAHISNFTTEEPWFKTQCTIGTYSLAAYWRDESWTCPSHWKITTCRYMYHSNAIIIDSTCSANAIIYDEAGTTILGKPCADLVTAETILSPKTLPSAIIEAKEKLFGFHLKVQLYTKIGLTGFNINRAEHIGETSASTATQPPFGRTPAGPDTSLPPQTPTRQSHRQPTTSGVKRSLPTETGSDLT